MKNVKNSKKRTIIKESQLRGMIKEAVVGEMDSLNRKINMIRDAVKNGEITASSSEQ